MNSIIDDDEQINKKPSNLNCNYDFEYINEDLKTFDLFIDVIGGHNIIFKDKKSSKLIKCVTSNEMKIYKEIISRNNTNNYLSELFLNANEYTTQDSILKQNIKNENENVIIDKINRNSNVINNHYFLFDNTIKYFIIHLKQNQNNVLYNFLDLKNDDEYNELLKNSEQICHHLIKFFNIENDENFKLRFLQFMNADFHIINKNEFEKNELLVSEYLIDKKLFFILLNLNNDISKSKIQWLIFWWIKWADKSSDNNCYIEMEDLTLNFSNPLIFDIKLGNEPKVGKEKHSIEKNKKCLSGKLGIKLMGCQIREGNKSKILNKYLCRKFDQNELSSLINNQISCKELNGEITMILKENLISRIKDINKSVEKVKEFINLNGCSLLIVINIDYYINLSNSKIILNSEININGNNKNIDIFNMLNIDHVNNIKIKIIDLGHSYLNLNENSVRSISNEKHENLNMDKEKENLKIALENIDINCCLNNFVNLIL